MTEVPDVFRKFGEEEEEGMGGWVTSYRTWRLGFHPEKETPRLYPVIHPQQPWEPKPGGEIESDYRGTPEKFKTSHQGLYSMSSLEELRKRYGHEGVTGAIIPYGTVIEHEEGTPGLSVFRSTKAKIKHLYTGCPDVSCSVCGKPSKVLVRQVGDTDLSFCEACRKELDKVLDRFAREGKDIREYSMDTLLELLADIYETRLEKWPY